MFVTVVCFFFLLKNGAPLKNWLRIGMVGVRGGGGGGNFVAAQCATPNIVAQCATPSIVGSK